MGTSSRLQTDYVWLGARPTPSQDDSILQESPVLIAAEEIENKPALLGEDYVWLDAAPTTPILQLIESPGLVAAEEIGDKMPVLPGTTPTLSKATEKIYDDPACLGECPATPTLSKKGSEIDYDDIPVFILDGGKLLSQNNAPAPGTNHSTVQRIAKASVEGIEEVHARRGNGGSLTTIQAYTARLSEVSGLGLTNNQPQQSGGLFGVPLNLVLPYRPKELFKEAAEIVVEALEKGLENSPPAMKKILPKNVGNDTEQEPGTVPNNTADPSTAGDESG